MKGSFASWWDRRKADVGLTSMLFLAAVIMSLGHMTYFIGVSAGMLIMAGLIPWLYHFVDWLVRRDETRD